MGTEGVNIKGELGKGYTGTLCLQLFYKSKIIQNKVF